MGLMPLSTDSLSSKLRSLTQRDASPGPKRTVHVLRGLFTVTALPIKAVLCPDAWGQLRKDFSIGFFIRGPTDKLQFPGDAKVNQTFYCRQGTYVRH